MEQMQAPDVHAHAMPLPLLRWLADQGLADTSEVEKGIINIDPKISGVGPSVPVPLARSQHDVAIRLTEMDTAGVAHHAVSPPPFLFASTADGGQLVAEVFADPLLRRLVEDYPGHVLLGTDHPFELGDRDPVATVTRLGLDAELTRRILWDDAARLLNLSDVMQQSG